MSQPFIGEIRLFPYNFAPQHWSLCSGQLLSIAQNSALFSLLGTFYGGNGTTTFALPDLRGRTPLHPDGVNYVLGEVTGAETATILASNLPAHSHALKAYAGAATSLDPSGNYLAIPDARLGPAIYDTASPATALVATAVGATGGSTPYACMPPFLCLSYCISTTGVFPSRN